MNQINLFPFFTSFNVSKELSNYGVVIFSDAGEYSSLRLKFNEVFDLETMVRRIERMPYKGYRTRIDLALQLADKNLFSEDGGTQFYISVICKVIKKILIIEQI